VSTKTSAKSVSQPRPTSIIQKGFIAAVLGVFVTDNIRRIYEGYFHNRSLQVPYLGAYLLLSVLLPATFLIAAMLLNAKRDLQMATIFENLVITVAGVTVYSFISQLALNSAGNIGYTYNRTRDWVLFQVAVWGITWGLYVVVLVYIRYRDWW
jgi:hypothetical protein